MFPTDNTVSENRRNSLLNNCPIGCSNKDKFFQDAVSQFGHNEITTAFEGIVFEVESDFAQLQ